MAWCSRAGATWGCGSSRARVDSILVCTPPIQAWKSDSVAFTGLGGGRQGFQDFAFEHLDLLLGGLQAALAQARELEPALVGGERLLERQFAAFHACDDFFQLGERF